jgi:hypothetical protein
MTRRRPRPAASRSLLVASSSAPSAARLAATRPASVVRGVNWRFAAEDVRIKLKHLYPQLRSGELYGEAAGLAWGEVPGLG